MRWFIIAVVLLLFAFTANAEVAVPPLKSPVTDLTGTLTPQQINELEATLLNFEKASGSQIAVLIVPSTNPEEIEQYSIRVVDRWKLGRKGIDDGILLLIAKDDRKLRIEVGYGLEGAVPDAIANRIGDDIIIPYFKNGDYYGGINAGIGTLIKVISGEPLPAPKQTGKSSKNVDSTDTWVILFFVGVFVTMFLQKILGKFLGSAATGSIVGFIGWIVMGTVFAAVIIGIIAFIIALFISSDTGRGGWSGGSGWGGGGGFGGGGSWGGGGGGFGGGGASGSW